MGKSRCAELRSKWQAVKKAREMRRRARGARSVATASTSQKRLVMGSYDRFRAGLLRLERWEAAVWFTE